MENMLEKEKKRLKLSWTEINKKVHEMWRGVVSGLVFSSKS